MADANQANQSWASRLVGALGSNGVETQPSELETGRVALVLAGGGIPGWMYEVGCLTALDEFFDDGFNCNRFDLYVGTSAGASIAAMLANGITPREVYDAVVTDVDSPYNFGRRDIYTLGTRETWPMLKKVVATSGQVVGQVMRGLFTRAPRPSLLDLLAIVQDSLPSGLFTLNPLEAHLRKTFVSEGFTNQFKQLKRALYIPAVDLDRGTYRIFGRDGSDQVPISRAVAASSAIPVLFQPVRIDGVDYIDGGIGRVANMDVAVDAGAGLVLVVNPIVHLDNDRQSVCHPTCHGYCRGLRSMGMAHVADQAARINTSMRLKNAKSRQEQMHPGLDIDIIEPSSEDPLMFTQNVMGQDGREEVVRYGYHTTVTYLTQHFERLSGMFSRHGVAVSLDRFRWRSVGGEMRVLGPNERGQSHDGVGVADLPVEPPAEVPAVR